jgi:hypothetical protein
MLQSVTGAGGLAPRLEPRCHVLDLAGDPGPIGLPVVRPAPLGIRVLGRHCSTCTCQAPSARQAS